MSLTPGIESEIRNFEAELARFRRGELGPERFRAFRLAFGVYGQRQPGVQMVRVRIPAGIVTGGQLAALARIAEEYADGKLHLTTRQDVQLYHILLERVGDLFRDLARAGLTTREACGNSVRNITACPLAGAAGDELFDVRPYALATEAFLLRNPANQQLARKFKISFSACPEDCAATAIHDIGLVGRIVTERGRARAGFRVLAGGGLGAVPLAAETLDEFVPAEDLLATVKAVIAAAALHGNRRNKARARLKFVVHREGIAWFRARVGEIREGFSADERAEADLARHVPEAFRPVRAAHAAGRFPAAVRVPPVGGPGTEGIPADWLSRNVRPHRDPARVIVTVKYPLGDIPAADARRLGELAVRFSRDAARLTIGQALVLTDVDRAALSRLHAALSGINAADAAAGTALDVTSCPGAASCSLAITASKGLAGAIRTGLSGEDPQDLDGVSIKVSGCPNSCGQHHVADIGFHGIVRRVGGRQLPAYQLHVGGRIGNGTARIGRTGPRIPAKNAPAAVRTLFALHRSEGAVGETLSDFLHRLDGDRLAAALAPLAEPREGDDTAFVDWGESAPYAAEVATGECAGAGADASADRLGPVADEARQAAAFIGNGQWADAAATLGRFRFSLARVVLEALGKRTETDYETLWTYRTEVIDRGHAGERWNDFHAAARKLLARREPDPEAVRQLHGEAGLLLAEARVVLGTLLAAAARRTADVAG